MSGGTLLIRADATVGMGTGHIMRSLALAQAWQDAGGRVLFAMAEATPSIRERLQSEHIEVLGINGTAGSSDDAREVLDHASKHGAEWLVLDGYHFGIDYQKRLSANGIKILLIDDNALAGGSAADVILDQNSNARADVYAARTSETRMLLGTRYALLRREFLAWLHWNRVVPQTGSRILVAMGGSDPDNQTLRVLQMLGSTGISGLQIQVAVGGSNPHVGRLKQFVAQAGREIELLSNTLDMPSLLASSDMVLIAGGGTLWEALFMGCAVLSLARNDVQRSIVKDLEAKAAAIYLEHDGQGRDQRIQEQIERTANSKRLRELFAAKGREIVDGRGAGRVVQVLLGNGDGVD